MENHQYVFPIRIRHLEYDKNQKPISVRLYEKTILREFLHYTLLIISLGITFLLSHWFPFYYLKLRYSRTDDIHASHLALITIENGNRYIVVVTPIRVSRKEFNLAIGYDKPETAEYSDNEVNDSEISAMDDVNTAVIESQCVRYLYNSFEKCFEVVYYDFEISVESILMHYANGIQDEKTVEERKIIYGRGCIEIPIPPLFSMLLAEIIHPFFVFLIASLFLWYFDEYYLYASVLLFITICSLLSSLYDMRQGGRSLQKIANFTTTQHVLRPFSLQTDSKNNENISTKKLLSDKVNLNIKDTGANNKKEPSTLIQDTQTGILERVDSIGHLFVHDESDFVPLKPRELVPADVVRVTYGTVACDMILLNGSVLVDESMLSGENTAKSKFSVGHLSKAYKLSSKISHGDFQNSKHILFGGTSVIQVRQDSNGQEPLGLVIRTAYTTSHGRMLQGILFPSGNQIDKFKYETYKFLLVLVCIAFIGAFITLYFALQYGLRPQVTLIRFFDTFTNAIPPILPATMAIGAAFAVKRLKRYFNIMCLQHFKINTAGLINTLVLDKTGTLTEEFIAIRGLVTTSYISEYWPTWADGLYQFTRVLGVTQSTSGRAKANRSNILALSAQTPSCEAGGTKFMPICASATNIPKSFIESIAACTDLAFWNNEVVGDVLETQLLHFSQYNLRDQPSKNTVIPMECHSGDISPTDIIPEITSPDGSARLRIIHRYPFVPELRRMTVLVECESLSSPTSSSGSMYIVICKGSPELLEQRCITSTLPTDFHRTLQNYTETGGRVIAYGIKFVPTHFNYKLITAREIVETNLVFLGFAVFDNRLKPDTYETISLLKQVGCRCLMSTGDNAITSAAVARQCGILDYQPTDLILIGLLKRQLLGEDTFIDDASTTLNSSNYDNLTVSSISSSENLMYTLIWKPLSLTEFDSSNPYSIPNTANMNLLTNTPAQKNKFRKPTEVDIDTQTAASTPLGDSQLNPYSCEMPVPFQTLQVDDSMTLTKKQSDQGLYPYLKKYTKSNIDYEKKHQYLSTFDLIKILNESDDAYLKPPVHLILTGPAFRYLYTECENNPDAYKIFNRVTPGYKTEEVPVHKYSLPKNLLSYIPFMRNVDDSPHARNSSKLYPQSPLKTHTNIGQDKISTFNSNMPWLNYETGQIDNPCLSQMPLFEYCIRTSRVFSRMVPQDKSFLITQLQQLSGKPLIAMCGDGANDCEALKAADIGVSLSGKTTSICAPFISVKKSIKSCYNILCEGRGALVNSFQSFKYVTLYASIQLFSTLFLFWYGGNLTDEQYLYIDLLVELPLTITMAWTHASTQLTRTLPLKNLSGKPIVFSVFGQIIIQVLFMCFSLLLVSSMDFYVRFQPDITIDRFEADDLESYENSVLFLLSLIQLLGVNIIFTEGKPWRKPRLSNYTYTLVLIILSTLAIMCFFSPELFPALGQWLSLTDMPISFRIYLFLFALVNVAVSYIYEKCIVGWLTKKSIQRDSALSTIDHKIHFA